jgi:hypothetical protein
MSSEPDVSQWKVDTEDRYYAEDTDGARYYLKSDGVSTWVKEEARKQTPDEKETAAAAASEPAAAAPNDLTFKVHVHKNPSNDWVADKTEVIPKSKRSTRRQNSYKGGRRRKQSRRRQYRR